MAETLDPRSRAFDLRAVNQAVIAEFRATGGSLRTILPGSRLLLLTTTGARTGRPHTTPLGYVPDGTPDRLAVYASNMAAPTHPQWYRNLVANPRVSVDLGTEQFDATATTAAGAERDRLYEALVEAMPGLRGHRDQTDREIPVVVLTATR